MSDMRQSPLLTADDLIADRALRATDSDQLDHLPIAERLAELVVSAEAPVNVALFGPWGSGKSSFAQLLKRALSRQKKRTKLVVYDTWTSAGESFQRSFISNAAAELGFKRGKRDGHDFHAGLYERKRGVRVSGADVVRFLVTLGIAIAGVFLLIGAGFWLYSLATGTPFASLIPTTLPPWLTASAIVGTLVALLKEGLAGAKLDVETSAPSQEQFRQTFRDLVARAKKRHKVERIVFFLDELDRCKPDQVNEVLAAVKHFLGQPSCVFIVAADREVMERALTDLPQANPVIVDAPYYSSASEFIDKVFQHQLSLPPLRMRRLSRFARELIGEKQKGIWQELREVDRDDRRLDEVLFVAVPRHVRSPRRVKVLLNNFATNARIAQARGIDRLSRAVEIAKLTALQTEFPLLAADLHREPRLLTFLLEPPAAPSPRLNRLLKKHRLPLTANEEAGGESPLDVTATDRQVVKESVGDLELVQRRQLLTYLRGTTTYRNPSHDLLFLEGAGKAVDLADAAFAEVLEAAAIEDPGQAVAAAARQSSDDQLKALSVLADLVSDEVGRERANATTALLGVARLLDYDIHSRQHEVLAALRLQHREPGFDDDHLPDVLSIATRLHALDLSTAVLSNDKLWATPERTGQVAAIADQLPKERRTAIWQRVGSAYAQSDDPLVIPLRALDAEVAEEMLDSAAVRSAIETRLSGSAESDEALGPPAGPLLEALDARDDGQAILRGSVLWDLLVSGLPAGYSAARDAIEQLDRMDDQPGLRNACALLAMEKLAPVTDFALWAQRVTDAADDAWDDEGDRAVKALARCFTEWSHTADLDGVVGRLLDHVPGEKDEVVAPALATPLASAMGSVAWWATNEDVAAQRSLHQVALSLERIGIATFGAASVAVLADLNRALTTPPRINNFQRALRTARQAAPNLVEADLERLALTLAAIVAPDPLDVALIQERLLIAQIAARKDLPIDAAHYTITAADVERLRTAEDFEANVERWLALSPNLADVASIVEPMIGSAGGQVRRAVAAWGRKRTAAERTDLLLGLMKSAPDVSSWVELVAEASLEELRFVENIGETVRSLTRAHERTDFLRSLAAFRPASDEAQHAVAELVIWLIDQGTKIDFENALVVVPALGANHGSTTRLNDVFKAAGDRGYEPKGRSLEHLARARVTLTKKRVSKSIWDRWRDLRG